MIMFVQRQCEVSEMRMGGIIGEKAVVEQQKQAADTHITQLQVLMFVCNTACVYMIVCVLEHNVKVGLLY